MQATVDFLKKARRIGTPLAAIETPDQNATLVAASNGLNGSCPVLVWDTIRMFQPVNKAGQDIVGSFSPEGMAMPDAIVSVMNYDPHKGDPSPVVFMLNAHAFMKENPFVSQALINARDTLKHKGTLLVLLGPIFSLPLEIQHDVMLFSEELPDIATLESIVDDVYKAAADVYDKPGNGFPKKLDGRKRELSLASVRGLSAFEAEQVMAMSIVKTGVSVDDLWEQKRRAVAKTPGLSIFSGKEKYEDIGGCEPIKSYLSGIMQGNDKPNAVVFIDEIEKSLAGSESDSSGVTQDQLGVLLSYMQDKRSIGAILVGPPGSGKSLIAKATGNQFEVPTVMFDMGGMKDSLVGSSEARIRHSLKVIDSTSGGKAIWLATCNSMANLPPEFRRRFSLGTWFFDLPTAEERKLIWKLWIGKYNLKAKVDFNDEGWTGAEIERCCDLAYRMDKPLKEAARFIVPVSKASAERIEKIRSESSGRFLSAATGEVYEKEKAKTVATGSGRKFSDN